jgi:hypothetical protein
MSLPNPCQIQEREVLAEYSRMASLLDKVKKKPSLLFPPSTPADFIKRNKQVANTTQRLSLAQPIILENLRPLERKMGLVLTLFKGKQTLIIHHSI